MYQLLVTGIVIALGYFVTPYLYILLPALGYLNRYEIMVACADVVLITLHILGLVPDPRYKTSHLIGVYTELDLIQHFEDVAESTQLSILFEYRNTLQKMGQNNVLPSGLDEQDERVTFSREFHQNHNLYPLSTPLSSCSTGSENLSSRNSGSFNSISFHADDFILAKKQQKLANTAINVAATGITIGATYAAYAASGIYSYASEKYTQYQQSNQQLNQLKEKEEQEAALEQHQIDLTTTTITTAIDPKQSSPLSIPVLVSNPNDLQHEEDEIDEMSLDSPPARIINPTPTKLSTSAQQQQQHHPNTSNLNLHLNTAARENLDQLSTILDEETDQRTDTFVDSLQRSFSSLFSTRKSLTSHYINTTGNNKSRFSIQPSSTSGLNNSLSNLGDASGLAQQTQTPLKSSRNPIGSSSAATVNVSSLLKSPGGVGGYGGYNTHHTDDASDQQQSVLSSAQPDTSNQYGPLNTSNQLRSRLHRLSNQPQQQESYGEEGGPEGGDSTASASQLRSTSLTDTTKPKQRISYVEKYRKLDQEREHKKAESEKTITILTQIEQNKNVKKLERQLHCYVDPSQSPSDDSSSSIPITISLTSFMTKLMSQSSIYQSLSRPSTSLSMLMSNHYKDALTTLMESPNSGVGVKDGMKLINIPLLVFRFVDYSTIHLVLLQFAYTFNNPTNQPTVPLTINNARGTKEHPTLNVLTSALPQISFGAHLQQQSVAHGQQQQITPLLLLSSTLTTYNIFDLIYVLNNYTFDKKFQYEFLSQEKNQIQAQIASSHKLHQDYKATSLAKSAQLNALVFNQIIENSYKMSPNRVVEMDVASTVLGQSPGVITIPQLHDKTNMLSPLSATTLSILSQDRQLAGENSVLLLPLGSVSHVVPGRRRSLYNAPISTALSSSTATMAMSTTSSPGQSSSSSSSSSGSPEQGQAAINSLHHSLFFSLVVDTDIYDFICLTSHQRDVIVKDLKDLVAGIVDDNHQQEQRPSTESTPSTTIKQELRLSNPVEEEQSVSSSYGGYNLRSRKKA